MCLLWYTLKLSIAPAKINLNKDLLLAYVGLKNNNWRKKSFSLQE